MTTDSEAIDQCLRLMQVLKDLYALAGHDQGREWVREYIDMWVPELDDTERERVMRDIWMRKPAYAEWIGRRLIDRV